MNNYLDTMAQEIYKYLKRFNKGDKTIGSYIRIIQLVTLYLGYYGFENNLSIATSKSYLDSIISYIDYYKDIEVNINIIRNKILDICNTKSYEQLFYEDHLNKEGKLLTRIYKDTDINEYWELNNEVYIVKITEDKIASVKKV